MSNDTSPPAPDAGPHALLVARAGPERRQARAALRRAGYAVGVAGEPYAGMAAFAERPAELVVLSLARFKEGDRSFVTTVKRRAPTTRVVLLVPSGRRRLALEALRAGADAWIREPGYAEELTALAEAFHPRHLAAAGALSGPLRALAWELQHAVNNPLTGISLLMGDKGVPKRTVDKVHEHVARITKLVGMLDRFSRLEPNPRAPHQVDAILGQVVEELEAQQRIRIVGGRPPRAIRAVVDPPCLTMGVRSVLDFLAGKGTEEPTLHPMPVPVKAGVRRRPRDRSDAEGRTVEILAKARGVRLDAAAVDRARGLLLWSPAATSREAHLGLAPAERAALLHGGRLVLRQGRHESILALRIPAA